ncbi:putative bifunctional diguanylate cyclase/phosphodiesterase [Sphaerochaeta sp.]|uniref:putative bifunctional diguanylate cyclase/phosphodiesterase n=1 Tax=Sphaerochaeta sp. TaxID=1972642 RepID=UPI002FCA50E9
MRKRHSSLGWKLQQTSNRHSMAFRMVMLALPILVLVSVAFVLFYVRLESLLDQEKQAQYQRQAQEYAHLIKSQIELDGNTLALLANSLKHFSSEQTKNLLAGLDAPRLRVCFSEAQDASLFAVKDGTVIQSHSIVFSDGKQGCLQIITPVTTYHAFFDFPESEPRRLIWTDEQGNILWNYEKGIRSFAFSTLDDVLPLWQQKRQSGGLITSSASYMALAELGGGYGYLVLESEDGLLQKAYLTILQASLTLAVLVSLLLLTLLFYLLYRDHQYEQSLMKLAFRDELTGLPNKNLFIKEAHKLLDRARSPYAVIVMDIGKFKLINDHFGYSFGDSLLLYCAKVLPRYTTKDGICARFSGDKFLLLVSYREKEVLERRMDIILAELKRFTFPGSSPFQLDILVGVSLINGEQSSIEAAIDHSLFALSALKEHPDVSYLYYDDVLKQQLLEESELEKVFSLALSRGEFFILLQPKYSLATKHLVGAEALVRWNHPTKGLLPPSQFIPLLEKHNLLVALDMFVLEQVCKLFVRWKQEGKPLLPISVNQSRSHLFNAHYENTLVQLVDRYQIPHHLMEFELTESLFMHDVKHLSRVLASLRRQSFLVSLDDFGSGYSSLAMLKDVKIDVIKMDQGFLVGTDARDQGMRVVKHVIALAKDLGITTVAEGVETQQQVDMLASFGCDVVQGFFFSQPLSIAHYEELLIDDRPRCFS